MPDKRYHCIVEYTPMNNLEIFSCTILKQYSLAPLLVKHNFPCGDCYHSLQLLDATNGREISAAFVMPIVVKVGEDKVKSKNFNQLDRHLGSNRSDSVYVSVMELLYLLQGLHVDFGSQAKQYSHSVD
jgi:hypothetical protein